MTQQTTQSSTLLNIVHMVSMFLAVLMLAFGLVYAYKGIIYIIIPGVLIAFAAMRLLVWAMIREKTKKRERNYTPVPEITMGIGYVLVFALMFPFCFHAIDVEWTRRDELKKAGIEKLNEVKKMRDAYNKTVDKKINSFKDLVENNKMAYFLNPKAGYKDSLESLLGKGTVEFSSYENNPSNQEAKDEISRQIEKVLKTKETNLRTQYALGEANTEFENFYQLAFSVFNNWDRYRVSYYYYDTDDAYQKLYKAAKAKMSDFVYADKVESKDIHIDSAWYSLTNAAGGVFVGVFLLYLLFHAGVSLPYLMVDRAVIALHPSKYKKEITDLRSRTNNN